MIALGKTGSSQKSIWADLGISKLRVLGASPKKYLGLSGYGLEVVECLGSGFPQQRSQWSEPWYYYVARRPPAQT